MNSPLILAIESSCDDTCAAVLRGMTELGFAIASQTEIHDRYGGVVPEVASRNHTMAMPATIDRALANAGVTLAQIQVVAVTTHPGLVGALLVGTSYARALALALNVPLVEVDHIQAHIAANFLTHPTLTPPLVAVVASGGHTSIFAVHDFDTYQPLDATADDALGEAFDKVGRVLGLPYPAGVHIDRLAKNGTNNIQFLRKKNTAKLSFSGLKTAVIQYLQKCKKTGQEYSPEDVCASFTAQACQTLIDESISACQALGASKMALAGGVAANSYLRAELTARAGERGIEVFVPILRLCTDNASMVAARAALALGVRNPEVP